jgi:hypothetical protein
MVTNCRPADETASMIKIMHAPIRPYYFPDTPLCQIKIGAVFSCNHRKENENQNGVAYSAQGQVSCTPAVIDFPGDSS